MELKILQRNLYFTKIETALKIVHYIHSLLHTLNNDMPFICYVPSPLYGKNLKNTTAFCLLSISLRLWFLSKWLASHQRWTPLLFQISYLANTQYKPFNLTFFK